MFKKIFEQKFHTNLYFEFTKLYDIMFNSRFNKMYYTITHFKGDLPR